MHIFFCNKVYCSSLICALTIWFSDTRQSIINSYNIMIAVRAVLQRHTPPFTTYLHYLPGSLASIDSRLKYKFHTSN